MRIAAPILAASAVLAGACEVRHETTIRIVRSDGDVTQGFACETDDGRPLFEAAVGPDRTLRFQVVVDLIDLGSNVPACLAEDVIDACTDGACRIWVADGATRYCRPLSIVLPPDITKDALVAAVAEEVQSELHGTVYADVPDRQVLVRVVATAEDCAAIQTVGADAEWPTLAPDDVLGCAYSCPTNLTRADGELSVGINIDERIFERDCRAVVQRCATFPDLTP